MLLKNKKVVVFGLEKTGIALIKKLLKFGAKVYATDIKTSAELNFKNLNSKGVKFYLGAHPKKIIKKADLIVVSPGVPWNLEILKKAREKKIPVISEIEFAFNFFKKPLIAITGTNGKSTTTALLGEFLKASGYKVKVAGNIGFPLIDVNDKNLDFIVAEISSFQLEGIKTFKPWISILLNITPDHLYRHQNMENYGLIKGRIFAKQNQNDYFIFNADDPLVKKVAQKAKTQKIPFSQKNNRFLGLKNNWIVSNLNKKKEKIIKINEIKIPGEHNLENSLAAIGAAKICGVKNNIIRKVLKSFKGLEHRLEFVRNLKGVTFINDSKATNPQAAVVGIKGALANQNWVKNNSSLHLIAGGLDKGTYLSFFAENVKRLVKNVIIMGKAQERLAQAFLDVDFFKFSKADSLKEAVVNVFAKAKKNDLVLLSPACASFDMFKNFEDRGRKFKRQVWKLN